MRTDSRGDGLGWNRRQQCDAVQSRARTTAQDQEPAIRNKVEKKEPRRVGESEGGEGKGREGNEGITIRKSEVIERSIQ
jgi:hypothetical protein